MSAWLHQKEAVEWALGRRIALLHLPMGAGKSRILVMLVEQLLRDHTDGRFVTLIGCPKAVIPAWKKQFSLWLPGIRVVAIDGSTGAKKTQQVESALRDHSPLVLVGNYESLWRLPAVKRDDYAVVCWDEVHRLKAVRGKASRWASDLVGRNQQAKIVGLSGTMLGDKPQDSYGVWRAVEWPECPTFGRNAAAFKMRYFTENPYVRGMIIGRRNEEEFNRKIADTTFRREPHEVWQGPETIDTNLDVELSAVEAKAVTELTKEFATEFEDGKYVTPKNALEMALRIRQACGGFIKVDEDDRFHDITDAPAKAVAFGEILCDTDRSDPVVVFCQFRRDIENVVKQCKSHGRSVSELSGKINQLADWQAGNTDVLVTQIASGGIGIDLTRSSLCVFYSVGYSLTEYLQARARLHRPGQEKTTRFFHLIATIRGNTTPDGLVYEALNSKEDSINGIVTYFRQLGHGS